MKLAINILSSVAVSLFIVIVVLLLVSSFHLPGLSFEVRSVLTGSMEPAIPTGSVVFSKSSAEYDEGDIITFRRRDSDLEMPITHRIMGKEVADGKMVYVTQGDANEFADTTVVYHDEIFGRVFWHVPFLGRLLDLARTPVGFTILIIIPAILVVIEELRRIRRLVKEKSHPASIDQSVEPEGETGVNEIKSNTPEKAL